MQAIINQTTYQVAQEGEQVILNGTDFVWDKVQTSPNHFHILKDNRSYNAEIVEANHVEKAFKIKVNGEIYDINMQTETDQMLAKMGIGAASGAKIANLKAPMPGLIYELKVQVGDSVQKGDVLLVLVAMKMENAIKATGNGKVKNIKIKIGDTVEKNQVLMEFE